MYLCCLYKPYANNKFEFASFSSGMDCWNPAFDVTPGNLITAIITEYGAFKPSELKKKLLEI